MTNITNGDYRCRGQPGCRTKQQSKYGGPELGGTDEASMKPMQRDTETGGGGQEDD